MRTARAHLSNRALPSEVDEHISSSNCSVHRNEPCVHALYVQALGVLLYVLVFGKLPFDGDSKLSILFGKYSLPPGKPAVLVDLIKDMLVTDPEQRPDIGRVSGWESAELFALHAFVCLQR